MSGYLSKYQIGLRKRVEDGLTLVELLITIAVLAIVTSIFWPITTANVTLISLEAQNRTLTEVTKFVEKWGAAEGTVTVVNGRLQSHYNGMDVDNITLPEGFVLTGSGTPTDPYGIASTSLTAAPTPGPTPEPVVTAAPTQTTTIIPDGTLLQPSTVNGTSGTIGDGLTFTRDETKVVLTSPRANWDRLRVTYTVSATNTVELFKKNPNGTIAGTIIEKVSNTEVHILLPSTQPFSLTVDYNGGSSGFFFFT